MSYGLVIADRSPKFDSEVVVPSIEDAVAHIRTHESPSTITIGEDNILSVWTTQIFPGYMFMYNTKVFLSCTFSGIVEDDKFKQIEQSLLRARNWTIDFDNKNKLTEN